MNERIVASAIYAAFIIAIYIIASIWWRWITHDKNTKDVSLREYWKFNWSFRMLFNDEKKFSDKERILAKNYGKARARFDGAFVLQAFFLILLFGGLIVIWIV